LSRRKGTSLQEAGVGEVCRTRISDEADIGKEEVDERIGPPVPCRLESRVIFARATLASEGADQDSASDVDVVRKQGISSDA
jgi:hypothetical protein